MGGFYGRVKFAQSEGVKQAFVRKTFERDREFFGAPMHLHVMFSSGFFLYEPDNPVWSDSLFINNRVFYGVTSETMLKKDKLNAQMFATFSKENAPALQEALWWLEPLSSAHCFYVAGEDILLMLPYILSERSIFSRACSTD